MVWATMQTISYRNICKDMEYYACDHFKIFKWLPMFNLSQRQWWKLKSQHICYWIAYSWEPWAPTCLVDCWSTVKSMLSELASHVSISKLYFGTIFSFVINFLSFTWRVKLLCFVCVLCIIFYSLLPSVPFVWVEDQFGRAVIILVNADH